MKKNRILTGVLCALLVLGLLAGCAPTVVVESTPTPAANTQTTGQESTQGGSSGDSVKTGLYFVGDLSESSSATADKNGDAYSNITLIAVTVDNDGVIDKCVIDAIRSDIYFDNAGKVVTDTSAIVESKNVLGDAYGMRRASSIDKEWNEQLAAVAEFAQGKKVSELTGLMVGSDGRATEDLASSATLYIGGFVNGIVAAAEAAQDLGAKKGDKLAIGSTTTINESKDATAEADGLARSYPVVAVLTLNGNTITSCIIDAMQSNVNFDATGTITSDITAAVASKNVLGDAYGMRRASGIGAEWNEQAAFFAEYVTGKTVSEVAGIAVDEGGHATDADIIAGTTVHINDFQEVIAKAAK